MKHDNNRLLENNISKLIECFNSIQHIPNLLSTPYAEWLHYISSNDFEFIAYLTNLIVEHHQQQQHKRLRGDPQTPGAQTPASSRTHQTRCKHPQEHHCLQS